MDESLLNEIGQLAEQLDNSLVSYQNLKQLPPQIHLEGLSGTMKDVRDRLADIYEANGGNEGLDLQA